MGAWNLKESGRKAPFSCNAAFSMLRFSFSFVAAQLLVNKWRPHCRKANVAVQLLQRSIPKTAAQLPFSLVACCLALFKSPSGGGLTKMGSGTFWGPLDASFLFAQIVGARWPQKTSVFGPQNLALCEVLGLKMQQKQQVRETFRNLEVCQTCFCAKIAVCCRDF